MKNKYFLSEIYIDDLDVNSVDVSNHILTWDDSNSTVKGYLYIASNDNSDNTLAIFEVTNVTDSSGYITVDVQNGTGTMPSDTEQCVLNFSRTGDKVQKGDK